MEVCDKLNEIGFVEELAKAIKQLTVNNSLIAEKVHGENEEFNKN